MMLCLDCGNSRIKYGLSAATDDRWRCSGSLEHAALASLPDRQRQAVILRHIEGLTNPEIADVLGVGVEAVESLTARGKRGLAAALQGQRAALGFAEEG